MITVYARARVTGTCSIIINCLLLINQQGASASHKMAAPSSTNDVRSYRWERLNDMDNVRVYSVAGYSEGKLYVFGEQCKNINS